MEKHAATRHIAIIDACTMSVLGLQKLLTHTSGNQCQIHVFRNSAEFLAELHRWPCFAVIYAISCARGSRKDSSYLLKSVARLAPQARRIVISDDRREAGLIRDLSPVSLHGILCKSAAISDLSAQLQGLLQVFPSPQENIINGGCRGATPGLSPTERVILYYMAEGLSIPEIAAHLARNTKTIRAHKFNAMTKLGVSTDTDLLCAADMLHYSPIRGNLYLSSRVKMN
ncbi:DNA-binding transcriptional activator BglJ [[Enterobacter] lignolyticus]|uniref:Transcriptional regulator, LuxR family n=1 Tax=Enterobacter lignolyticus (strain SCF1) TaxID=701347 RepID=E3GAU5_ENTLS|nr:DNA-binding transcriptional activator BglJ [[Enterobacter] lignolyticus]ADO50006.1 transcriptional regulator, LuxR family [[Enterobacter] lignolyticus SCF1]